MMPLKSLEKKQLRQWLNAGVSMEVCFRVLQQNNDVTALLKVFKAAYINRLNQLAEDLELSREFALTFKNPAYTAQWFKSNLQQAQEDLTQLLLCVEQHQVQALAPELSKVSDDELMQEIEKLLA